MDVAPEESAVAVAVTPVAGPVTRIWNGSNSLRAALIDTAVEASGAWSGRTLKVAPATETVAAFTHSGTRARTAAARIVRRIEGSLGEGAILPSCGRPRGGPQTGFRP